MQIFSDYDWQKLELKKNKIEKAQIILGKLKTDIDSLTTHVHVYPTDPKTIERISDLKEAAAKLNLPVQYLKGVGPKMADRFAAKKIATVEDLLFFLPRTYEDRRETKKINRLELEKIQTAMGTVTTSQYRFYGRKKILETVISDGTANLTAKWFKGQMSYLLGIFKKGTKVIFTGAVRPDYNGKAMIHPDYEILGRKRRRKSFKFQKDSTYLFRDGRTASKILPQSNEFRAGKLFTLRVLPDTGQHLRKTKTDQYPRSAAVCSFSRE